MKKGYLILENGMVFPGTRIGADLNKVGELAFTTGMAGYLETLTDPSYFGQIILQTFPLIGNYGVIEEDFEGKSACFGYIVREECDAPSNFRCQGKLDDYLKRAGIPGLSGIETRAVTRVIRQYGAMNAMIADQVPTDLSPIRSFRVTNSVPQVTTAEKFVIPAEGGAKYRVALIDYGAKKSIAASLAGRGCEVTVYPANASAEEILAGHPDGVMLSNGPGDPADNPREIGEIAQLAGRVPLFGICLGHQMLALAMGAKTKKMHFGHRGANQPARDLLTGRTYVTSQNHGYEVDAATLPGGARLRFINANDGSCEGVDYPGVHAFSVQFHPEACAGPLDTRFLFDRFLNMMEEK